MEILDESLTKKIKERLDVNAIAWMLCQLVTSQPSLLLEEGSGWLQGYTQIPRGGDYGSTSLQRPSFNELGLSHDPFFHTEAALDYPVGSVFMDYFRFTPQQHATLEHDLISHNRSIPAGNAIDITVHYNWYQAGLGVNLPYFSQRHLQPTLAVNWLKFLYRFSSAVAYSHRDFNLVTASIGIKAERLFHEKWVLDLSGQIALPVSALMLFNGTVGIHYATSLSKHIALFPRLSIGMIYLDYEDQQNIPNHIRYQLAPYCALGIQLG